MLVRALIVVLLFLNLGVAIWWALRPAAPAYQVPVSDAGGAALELLPLQAAQAAGTAAPVAACDPAEGEDGQQATAEACAPP
jgi:predicted lipid-binding transport protein (Tim44 family)